MPRGDAMGSFVFVANTLAGVVSVVAVPAKRARTAADCSGSNKASDEVGMASNCQQRCRENECRVGNGMEEQGADGRFSRWTTKPRTIGSCSSQYYLSLALAQ